jgi:uncharacterized protein YbcC (UPF0753/DUF2309 family)
MTRAQTHTPRSAPLASAIDGACRAIAPNWPLDRQIAVNPFWGFIDRPFVDAAAAIARLTGSRMTLALQDYGRAWRAGEITPAALARALAEQGGSASLDDAVAALQASPRRNPALPLLSDVLDGDPGLPRGLRWRETITQQISQYCASYFDEHQADWHRTPAGGLFEGWRSGLQVDHALEPLMHAPEIRARARDLPPSAEAAIAWSLDRLGIAEDAEAFLQVCLLRINGWASWCAYLGWEAGLAGASDPNLRALLAIRTSWEALLDDGRHAPRSPAERWREQWHRARRLPPAPQDAFGTIWQRAQEISYQDRLIGDLRARATAADAPHNSRTSTAQLVFCIDVRSERFRRALESASPDFATRGFAGFFGLPIRYRPIGITAVRPQLPGLLAPSLEATDSTGDAGLDRRIRDRRGRALRAQAAWQPFQRLPTGNFSLVETLGLGYLGALLRRRIGRDPEPLESRGLGAADLRRLRPQLPPGDAGDVARRADLVASILRAMSLTSGFARLLVLVGHGSQSANNPQAAALDCGACGGHSGEVNARALATLLNDPALRAALRDHDIHIPTDTIAIAALHNTTTDEVRLFDLDTLPTSHAPGIERLRAALAEAGGCTRSERAPSLGLGTHADRPAALLREIRRRARDWAQTRPEWGLADNAAFIVAPRARTRGVDLAGRAFLHDYAWREDRDGQVLELIMTAPMIVAHWINLQYYASTVAPERFGSGNKVLHNVACGHIGVFEGNTGDLRVGLSRQSVHDGARWMHTPLRLSVFVDAPRDMIDRVIGRHATVRQLVENEWLHLFRIGDDGSIEGRGRGGWEVRSAAPPHTRQE